MFTITSISMVMAAAQKRVRSPAAMQIPPMNSTTSKVQKISSAGSSPILENNGTKVSGPLLTLPQPCTARIRPEAQRTKGQASGVMLSYKGCSAGNSNRGVRFSSNMGYLLFGIFRIRFGVVCPCPIFCFRSIAAIARPQPARRTPRRP